MDEDVRAVLAETLVREAVGLAVIAGLLWGLGPGKVWLEGVAHRVRSWHRRDQYAGIIRDFSREVSRWDHEQAAQPDRRAGGSSPCGCGG